MLLNLLNRNWFLVLAGAGLLACLGWARPAAAAPLPDGPTPQAPAVSVAPSLASEAPAHSGVSLAAGAPIGRANLGRLSNAAQWGNGTLLAVAVSPDGRYFVAGSAFRLAVYSNAAPQAAPRWLNLDPPLYYDRLAFSADGQYLRFDTTTGERLSTAVRSLADGQVLAQPSGLAWVESNAEAAFDASVTSADGRLRLDSHVDEPGDDYFRGEYSIREVFDAASGARLYGLPDPSMYVRYADRATPEGCDLYSFSYCGNVYDPAVMTPYRAAFAPRGDSLAVLYRATDTGNSQWFSVLKVYDTSDGQLRQVWGTFAQPVQDFAYTPDGKRLLVGFVDGSLTLWDLASQSMRFGARHFGGSVYDLAFSADSSLLLLKTPGELEIRRAHDGSLWQRLAADVFAASPVEDLLALGQANGWLQMLDLLTGRLVYGQQAHSGGIYALAFSPDGKLLASSGQDCRVVLGNAHSGEFQHLFQENVTDAYGEGTTRSRIFIDAMTFVPGTQQLIGYGSWSRVASWDVASGATQYLIEPQPLDYYEGMQTLNPHFPEFFEVNAPQNNFMVDSARYDLGSGQQLGAYQPPATLEPGCAGFGPVTRDGAVQFTRGYGAHAGQVCVLDAADQHLLRTLTVMANPGSNSPTIGWPYLSPDGSQLAVTVADGPVFMFQVGV